MYGKRVGTKKIADRRGINAIYALRLEVVNSSTSATTLYRLQSEQVNNKK